jgi:hypothetical protein
MVRTFSTFVLSSPRRIRVSVFGVCRRAFDTQARIYGVMAQLTACEVTLAYR